MAYGRNQIVWLVAACAALAAQVVPQALCLGCDRPCCASAAVGIELAACPSKAAPAGGCPACAAAADRCPIDPAEPPCGCQLDSRQDEPMASSRGTLPSFNAVARGFLPSTALAAAPQPLGVSREYLAGSLAVPIRPPRILFGVWRN